MAGNKVEFEFVVEKQDGSAYDIDTIRVMTQYPTEELKTTVTMCMGRLMSPPDQKTINLSATRVATLDGPESTTAEDQPNDRPPKIHLRTTVSLIEPINEAGE
jgi:hypothetical protein